MRPVPSSPMWVQVSPPSVDFQAPFPIETFERIEVSPVPAHTTAWSLGATARAPMECTGWSSNTGRQCRPASSVFQMPPVAAPAKYVLRSPGTPATEETRLPTGPMWRARSPSYCSGVSCWAASGAAAARAKARLMEKRRTLDMALCLVKRVV